jgi:hypothetical protein
MQLGHARNQILLDFIVLSLDVRQSRHAALRHSTHTNQNMSSLLYTIIFGYSGTIHAEHASKRRPAVRSFTEASIALLPVLSVNSPPYIQTRSLKRRLPIA